METPSQWSQGARTPIGRSTEKLVEPRIHDLDREQELQRHAHRDKVFEGRRDSERSRRRKRKIIIGAVVALLVLLAIVIPIAVVFGNKNSSKKPAKGTTGHGNDTNIAPGPHSGSNLPNSTLHSIPQYARGGYLDPTTWYDTLDFNVTFTNATVGGLYIMGLNDTWDDSTRANPNVPALNETWQYGTVPYRGVNIGGWLSIEPFITPSLFSKYPDSDGVVDEWTLCEHLGADKAKSTLEQHYSEWVQESTFAEIQAAGFDHIRVPFSYWAVTTYEGDPYVPMVSWRYLLRGIEWARKYGLRVYLDLHAVPGSQNGWNHSGRGGKIDWLIGPDGPLNGQRSLDIHNQLSTFFSQPRYTNIVTLYGLVNEPRMYQEQAAPEGIPTETLFNWYGEVIPSIRSNGYTGLLIMGDGLLPIYGQQPFWPGQMQGVEGLVLDAHPYMIFDEYLASLNHYNKINYACADWTQEFQFSVNEGFGPTMVGEWSQGDTDCSLYVNGVGVGARWDGTFDSSTPPTCPAEPSSSCACTDANAKPADWSADYKQWLLQYSEAQMQSFENSWGWFYWTWTTETAPQWSYKDGLAAGVLPKKTYERSWDCSQGIFNFNTSSLPEWY